jgi:hypothetical protein
LLPLACWKSVRISNALVTDLSLARIRFMSSAYCASLVSLPPPPGM